MSKTSLDFPTRVPFTYDELLIISTFESPDFYWFEEGTCLVHPTGDKLIKTVNADFYLTDADDNYKQHEFADIYLALKYLKEEAPL